jgi:hypothetical protein
MEVYGNEQDPDYWAKKIMKRFEGRSIKMDDVSKIMADNQIFQRTATDEGVTIADQFYRAEPSFQGKLLEASKNRVGGWESMQRWLSMAPDGKPYWQITEDCVNLIRTIPAAIHDENKVEDIDQSGEDDALDSSRYKFSGMRWIDAKVESVSREYETPQSRLEEELDEWDEVE